MTYKHLTLRMFESAKRNDGMVDQKVFKTAKRYGFDSVYFNECSMDMIKKYIKYIRPLLTSTCEYVSVNRKGKQFQKLTELLSVLVSEAIGKYIHPTRYRQIIETQSCEVLLPSKQKWISEDQKHSSNVARVHYQKKRSQEVTLQCDSRYYLYEIFMPYVFKMSIAIHENLPTSKQSCEKIFTMLIFDVSHMTEKIWRCSIFQVDHAISFKNMITR